MGKRGQRTRIFEHVSRDKYGYEVQIRRAGRLFSTRHPLGTSEAALRRAVGDLLDRIGEDRTVGEPGTFARDVVRYCDLAQHLSEISAQRAHLRAALDHIGRLSRRQVTRDHILKMRAAWLRDGAKPKTVNNRLSALRALWHLLDGPEAATPMDRLLPLKSHRTPPAYVSPATIVAVERTLAEHERRGWLRDAKTRARFRVLATTGVRPSELMRAEPSDVQIEQRVWQVRDGKGGYRPVGVPLTPAAVEAWQLFVQADAWGPFDTYNFGCVLRTAGWPAHVRPYALRHSLGMALSEAGVDLADISLILGHTRVQTTRTHYVGPLYTRMVQAMRQIEQQVAWVPTEGSDASRAGKGISGEKQAVGTTGSTVGRQAKARRKGQ
jgi:integrase